MWLYPNNGLGEFTEDTKQEVYFFPDPETEVAIDPVTIKQIVSVGDITQESEEPHPDFVAVIGDQLRFLPGSVYGTVDSGYLIGNSGWGVMQLASPGDADGDGFADLIARNTATGDLWVYHGKSAVTRTATVSRTAAPIRLPWEWAPTVRPMPPAGPRPHARCSPPPATAMPTASRTCGRQRRTPRRAWSSSRAAAPAWWARRRWSARPDGRRSN
ncbi:hypothetical protein [Streptomyces sp. V4I2]|uniref:hypothetical protein n=1 Tax=Streptomyces sp. V4I2 TaxID=3042280 RepID=UPI002785EEEC|nr:hypothetical protein [Streptomyces sp. V4I2]MDQ1049204.1 hypothetical protein [Streptomyces sp. V4I2]